MAQEHTIANFLTANLNGAFPLDTDGLAALQGNLALLHALGRMSGCACVLSGCANAGDAGLVFWYDPQRNSDFPDGEVLPVVSGSQSDTLYLVEKPVSVTVAGQTIMNAYTERHLEWGTGRVTLNYSDFRTLDADSMTLQGLDTRMRKVEAKIPTLEPLPIGSVIMWAGTQAPNNNYLVCDGNHYFVEDYPDLAEVLDGIYQYEPVDGKFQVPDFRSRMPVGFDPNSLNSQGTDWFNVLGKTGGEVKVKLLHENMPSLTGGFAVTDKYGPYAYGAFHDNGRDWSADMKSGASDTWRHEYVFDNGGQYVPHNNMPPFMTINYIIRAK